MGVWGDAFPRGVGYEDWKARCGGRVQELGQLLRPPFAEADADAAAVFRDEFDACFFQLRTDGLEVSGVRGSCAPFEIDDGLLGEARGFGELGLAHLQKGPRAPALVSCYHSKNPTF